MKTASTPLARPSHPGVPRRSRCLIIACLLSACSGERSDETSTLDASIAPELDAAVASDAVVATCIEVSTDVRVDTTWEDHITAPGEPDYCVTAPVVVLAGATLTIAPGATVAFSEATFLRVARAEGATLRAVGTRDAPIVLRGASAGPGYWQGVEIMSNELDNRLEHVRLSDAGGGVDVFADDVLDGVSGALVLDSEPGVSATASVREVTFENNLGFGLVVEWISELGEFAANRFVRNAEGAMLASQGNVQHIDPETTFVENGFDGVLVSAVTNLELPGAVTWRALSSGAYWIRESIELLSDVTIEAGAVLVFDADTGLSVPQNASDTAAQLVVAGTAERKVTLRGVEESRGSWAGLEIASGRDNRIEHAEIAHAATGIRVRRAGAFAPAKLDVLNSSIRQSANCGIENTSSENTLTLTELEFAENTNDRCDP